MKLFTMRLWTRLKTALVLGLPLMLLGSAPREAQAVPPTPGDLTFTMGSVSGMPGAQVVVPVRASNFTRIALFQFPMYWDTNLATFMGVEQFGLMGLAGGSFAMTTNGSLRVSWDDLSGTSSTVTNGAILFAIRLQLMGMPGATSSIAIGDDAEFHREAADESLMPISVAVVDGQITILQVDMPPMITTQPVGQTNVVGDDVTFSVTASGTAPLSYQWRLDGSPLAGRTATNLMLTHVQQSQAGGYTVVITNIAGAVTSTVAPLRVNLPPDTTAPIITIVSPTGNPTYATDTNFLTLAGTASDNLGVTQVNWVNNRAGSGVASGTNNWSAPGIMLLPGVNVITVTARDAADNTGTNNLTVTYTPPPSTNVLRFVAGNVHGLPGEQVLIPIAADGFTNIHSFSFSFHWNSNHAEFLGVEQFGLPFLTADHFGTTSTNNGVLTVAWNDTAEASETMPDGGTIFAVRLRLIGAPNAVSGLVVDGNPTPFEAVNGNSQQVLVTSGAGQLTIDQPPVPPSITTQPQDQTVLVGSNAAFNVVAEGTLPLRYQWHRNQVPLAGRTTSQLSLSNVQLAQSGEYTVVVTNIVGAVTSVIAHLTVELPPNTPPFISDIPDKVTLKNQLCPDISFRVTDAETPAGELTLRASSSNPALVHVDNITFGGTGTNRTVRIAPATNQTGVTTITITVSDGDRTASDSFVLWVDEPATDANLIAYWRLDDNSGLTAADAAGTNVGTLVHGPAWTSGRVGGALNFDGIDDVIHVPDADALDLENKFSIAFWFNPTLLLNANSGRKDLLDKSGSYGLMLNYLEADGKLAFVLNSNAPVVKSVTVSWPSNQWCHAAATYDGAQMKLYVNGSLEGTLTTTVPATASTTALQIGGSAQGFYFPGALDEVRLYNAALSSNDVRGLFLAAVTNRPNAAPVFMDIDNMTVSEGSPLTFTIVAADPDAPVQSLTYSLESNLPTGASLGATNGAFAWTPGEDQGPGEYTVTFHVTDNGLPPLSDSRTILLTVLEVNQAPILPPIESQAVNEGDLLTFTVSATDPDRPRQNLRFSLGPGAPAEAGIDATNGFFSWIPNENEGPNTRLIPVIVRDDGVPSMSATQNVTIAVFEINRRPVFQPVADQLAQVLIPVRITNLVTDPDQPTNQITFELAAGPKGVRINKFTGLLRWLPAKNQSPSTNLILVVATDDGDPPQSAINAYRIIVDDYLELSLGTAVLRTNESGTVPINIVTTAGVTNLTALLTVPDGRLADNLAIQNLAPEFSSGNIERQGSNLWKMSFTATNGQFAPGGRVIAQLAFTAISTNSAFVPLTPSNVDALRPNGLPVLRTLTEPGRITLVGDTPLLEALARTNVQGSLILYGQPENGYTYVVESTTDFPLDSIWPAAATTWVGSLTNLSQKVPAAGAEDLKIFRAYRQTNSPSAPRPAARK